MKTFWITLNDGTEQIRVKGYGFTAFDALSDVLKSFDDLEFVQRLTITIENAD